MTDLSKLSIEELQALRNRQLATPNASPSLRRNPALQDASVEQLLQMRKDANPAYWGGSAAGIPTSPGVDQFISGLGQGGTELYRGGKERLGQMTPEEVDAARIVDKPLLKTGPGAAGSFAGKAIPAAATLAIPGANTYMGAAITGGVLGALEPTGTGDSAAANTAAGVAGGVLGQGFSNLARTGIAPIRSNLSPEQQRLAQVFADNNIPLDLAQRTNSKPLKTINAVLENLPFTSGAEAAKRTDQRQAFTAAVMRKAGNQTGQATPDVVNSEFDRLGGNFNDIYSRNSVGIDDPLLASLIKANDEAGGHPVIAKKINEILGFGDAIPGQRYQDKRTQLRNLQGSTDPEVRGPARDIKYALDSAARRSVSPQDSSLLDQTRQEYGNLSTVAKAQKSAGAVNGEIPPLQLRQVVANSDPRGYVRGKGDLNDLARGGATFMRDEPNSGTAQRMMYQGAMTGGLGLGTYLSTDDPTKALGAASMGLLGPVALQRALKSGLLGEYLASSEFRGLLSDEAQKYLAPLLVGAGSQYRLQ